MYSIQANYKENSEAYTADCKKTTLISELNILLPSQIIVVLPAKGTTITGTKPDKFTNVIVNPFLCIDSSSLYVIPAAQYISREGTEKILLFVINVGSDNTKTVKATT